MSFYQLNTNFNKYYLPTRLGIIIKGSADKDFSPKNKSQAQRSIYSAANLASQNSISSGTKK